MQHADAQFESVKEFPSKNATFLPILEAEPELADVQAAQQLTNAAPDPCPCQCKPIIYTGL